MATFWFQNPLQSSFWFQNTFPKKKEEEPKMTELFPWLTSDQVKKLNEATKDIPAEQRLQKQQEYYEEALPILKARREEKQRITINNNLRNDPQANTPQYQQQIRINDLLTKFKAKENLSWIDDEKLLTAIMSFNDEIPLKMADYINWKNENILYELWLKEKPVEQKPSDFQEFITPVASFTQWLSDIWQGIIWQPMRWLWDKAARQVMKMFWYSDEELDEYEAWRSDNQWDITEYLWGAQDTLIGKWSRELGKIAWSASLTAWMPRWAGLKIAGTSGKELIKNVALRTLIEWGRWLTETAAYNLWTSWDIGDPVSLELWAWIWATLWWPLWLLWSKVITPWINKLATKLQLSGLLNRSRLDRLSTILKQWWEEQLAKWTPEDVANRMFQRNIQWTKQQVIDKLDQIRKWSMELLNDWLVWDTRLFKNEAIDEALWLMQEFYKGSRSQSFKNKASEINSLIAKNSDWWLTLQEINNLKKSLYDDINIFTDSWRARVAKEDLASLSRELKNLVEDNAETTIGVKLLNNEYAMANSMKQAIEQKLNTDVIGEILSFVSNRWGTSIAGAIAWGGWVWPFDRNTVWWKLGNVLVWFAVGRFMWSTQAKTSVAKLLKNLTGVEKAAIMKYINWEKVEKKNILTKANEKLNERISKEWKIDFSDVTDTNATTNLNNTRGADNVLTDQWIKPKAITKTETPVAKKWSEGIIDDSLSSNTKLMQEANETTQSNLSDIQKTIKKVEKLNDWSTIKLVRGSWNTNNWAWEAMRGKWLYLTDNVDVAKYYWDDIKVVEIKNSNLLDWEEIINNKLKDDIIKNLPEEMKRDLLKDSDYTYNRLVRDIEWNTGIDWETVSDAINTTLKKKNYKWVRYKIWILNDTLVDMWLWWESAFIMFSK